MTDPPRQNQKERELRHALKRQQAIFDGSLVGIFFVRENRVITQANRRTCELLGYDVEELVGHTTEHLHLSREHFLSFGEAYYSTLRRTGKVHLEWPLRHKDGRTLQFQISGRPIEHGDLSRGVVWVIDDITLQKQAKQEMENKNIALREVLASIEKEKQQISRNIIEQIDRAIQPLLTRLRQEANRNQARLIDAIEEELAVLEVPKPVQLQRECSELSPTELRVCHLIRRGKSTKEIAVLENVSTHTVQTHRRNIRKKLGVTGTQKNLEQFLGQFYQSAPPSEDR